MAKAKAKETSSTPEFDKPRGGCRPVWACLFFVIALWVFVSLWHFEPEQSARNITDPTAENLGGRFGAELAWSAFFVLGGAGWLLAAASFYLSYMFLLFPKSLGILKLIAIVTCTVAGAALLNMQQVFFLDDEIYLRGAGGLVGSLLYENLLRHNFGIFGSLLALSIVNVFALFLLFTNNIGESFQKFFFHFGEWKTERAARKIEKREARQKERELKQEAKEKKREERRKAKEEKAKLTAQQKLDKELDGDDPVEVVAPTPAPKPKKSARASARAQQSVATPTNEEAEVSLPLPKPSPDASPRPQVAPASNDLPKPKIIKSETPRKAPVKLPERIGDYHFPTLDLLAKPEPIPSDDRENHEERAKALIHTLSTFGVDATVDEIHVGPVITRFDILPAPGTKVSKIQGLENDIAMGLKAHAVRILAPVPGKGCVGVEIPNRQPQPVCLREIIESEDWSNSRAEIPIGLGKDVSGKPLVADLTKMPHLLIAGSTGSGKTVSINSIIASLLYHASPEELRFIMVDPKIVEMKVFNDLPHMLIPVVTEPKKVPGALKWLLNEMERRYQCFAAIGVRNIAGFRAYRKKQAEREKAAEEAANAEPNEIDGNLPEAIAPEVTPEDGIEIPKTLPYIVCIIDELADLMMVAPAEIETGIARLAQLARAAGIHLILATQRPSVNVITGVIKANLPSRISFKVASKVDSRTILDTGGADTLIGRGDMLFLPPGSSRLIRSQGAFVSDEEIVDIVEYLKQNGPPQFAEEVQRQVDSGGDDDEGLEGGGDEDDELFQDALEVLRNTKRASTSMLQRRLRIGYNRAARLMELMEQRGVVGPENGSSPREILVDLESM